MKMKRLVSLLLAAVLVLTLTPGVHAATFESDSGTFVKISHPDKDLSQTDGIVDYVGDGRAYSRRPGSRSDRRSGW